MCGQLKTGKYKQHTKNRTTVIGPHTAHNIQNPLKNFHWLNFDSDADLHSFTPITSSSHLSVCSDSAVVATLDWCTPPLEPCPAIPNLSELSPAPTLASRGTQIDPWMLHWGRPMTKNSLLNWLGPEQQNCLYPSIVGPDCKVTLQHLQA